MEGNQMKIREALENIQQEAETTCEYMDYPIAGAPGERGTCPVVDADWIIDACKTALSKPPRNCDVGSEEEQSRRYEAFCEAHHMQCNKGCSACPCSKKSGVSCELYWAQLPYVEKEGDNK